MPEPALLLVRYGEIGIKSPPVRRRFEALLGQNILRGLRARGAEGAVEHPWGRLLLRAPEDPARDTLRHTFGVVSFSPAREAPGQLEALAEFVGRASGVIPPRSTFAVRARRAGEVGYTSSDVARAAGSSILALHRERGLAVDLDEPDVEVVVEVREGHAWVAFETVQGPGGLPVGSEGRVSAWVPGPAGALAAWMMMKRGCRVDVLAPAGLDEGLARALAAWDPGLEVAEVDAPPEAPRDLVLAMLRSHAHRRGGQGVVLGDRFAAATALAPLDADVDLPVFRPLLALEDAQLLGAAEHLGTSLAEDPAPAPAAGDAAARASELLRAARRRKVAP